MATTILPRAAGRSKHAVLTLASNADNVLLDRAHAYAEIENRDATELWCRADGIDAAFNGEIQSVGLGAATAGTVTLGLLGVTTAAIAFNATVAAIQAALVAAGIPATTVVVSGAAFPGVAMFTFGGPQGGIDQAAIVVTPTGLTGGTVAVLEVLKGGSTANGADGTYHVPPGGAVIIDWSQDPHDTRPVSVISTAAVKYSVTGLESSG